MLYIFCNRCKKEIKYPGGLVFSPPDAIGTCTKYHMCSDCFSLLLKWMKNV